ncbi:MAG: hypothetical protein JJ863_27545 [Deltaproteobacteria bacterium]|nr:hypothetical protein [Deltaproteobacteria bacterium]
MKRGLLAFLVIAGCTCELDDPPPSTDTPPIPPGCGRLAIPTCWDDCCSTSRSPFIDESTCNATCPSGTRPFFDACTPAPACTDGFFPPPCMEGPDAGPPPLCRGGECCDTMFPAFFDAATCRYTCGAGTSFSCTPDPVACDDDLRACTETSDCVVTDNQCCHVCGDPSLEDRTAVHRENVSELRLRLCDGDPSPECDSCETGWNASIIPTCQASACAAVDISRLPMAACTTNDDCMMRARECCECGARTELDSLIALRPDGLLDYLGLICDTDAICDDCVPTYPDGVEAACVSGVCEVVFTPDSGG